MNLVMEFDNMYPISTNDMYEPTYHRTKHYSYLRKSSTLLEFQDNMKLRLSKYESDIKTFIEYSKSKFTHLGLKLTIWIGMNDILLKTSDNLRGYDTSNYIKALEDSISTALGIDDRYNMEVKAIKYKIDSKETWYTVIQLEPVDYLSYKLPNIELPTVSKGVI